MYTNFFDIDFRELFLDIIPRESIYNDPYALPFTINLGINHYDTGDNYSYFFICNVQQYNDVNIEIINKLLDLSKNDKITIRTRNKLNLFIRQNPDSYIKFEEVT